MLRRTSETTLFPYTTLFRSHEDADLVVLNKPAGLTVHPGAGRPDGTLQNALLHRYPQTARLDRGGLVHRLDKDTSGLMRSEEHTSELQSHVNLVCRLLLEKK